MISSNSERKRFFIFDGYALLYRAHFALIKNPLVTSYGLHTSALYGFTNQVLKLIDKEKPDYVACAFDSKEKTFRHHMFNDYKAQRPEMPNELQSQLPHLWELLNFLNLPTLKKPGYEADDLIGTLAVEANKNKLDTYIVSGDKDFMQLINEHIFLYSPGTRWKPKATIYDSKGVEKKWGVKPNKIIDLLGLMGDASDNIPGASGIGEKTAVKLIKEYGSLENALKNAENIKNKRIQNGLQSNQDLTLLSKKLVTIKTDLNLELSVKDLKLKEINKNNSLKKFRELEFFALEKLISNSENDNLELKTKNNFKTVTSKDQLQKLVNHFKNSKKLTFSVEITSENPFSTSIIGFSFYSESKIGWYVPINHNKNNGNNFSSNNLDYILKNLKPVFENKNSLKVAHNVKFFSILLKNNSITLKGKYFDTQLAAHLINPESKNYSIDSLSIEYIGDELLSKDDILGKGRDKKTINDISLQQISNYSLHNVEALFQLEKILKKKLTDLNLMDYYEEIELPMVTVLEVMELNGTYVDIDILSDMSKKNDKVLKDLKKKIYHISGSEFNLNSSQQLANILFDELKLPQVKKRSTAEDVLKILSSYNQIPAYIIKYRKKNKLKTTYFDSLPEFVNAETSRIHTTFNQTVAATGRLSSTNPNFQNIPIRSEEGKEIRKGFFFSEKELENFVC